MQEALQDMRLRHCPSTALGGLRMHFGKVERTAICLKYVYRELKYNDTCDKASYQSGHLLMLICEVQKDSIPPIYGWGAFQNQSEKAIGLKAVSEMKQCFETTNELEGASYSLDWIDHPVDSSLFTEKGSQDFNAKCGAENPPWPIDLPRLSPDNERRADNVSMGKFTTDMQLDTAFQSKVDWPAPNGWTKENTGTFTSKTWQVAKNGLGQVRTTFFSNGFVQGQNKPVLHLTAIGLNNNGHMEKWQAPFPCWDYSQAHFAGGKTDSGWVQRQLDDTDTILFDLPYGYDEKLDTLRERASWMATEALTTTRVFILFLMWLDALARIIQSKRGGGDGQRISRKKTPNTSAQGGGTEVEDPECQALCLACLPASGVCLLLCIGVNAMLPFPPVGVFLTAIASGIVCMMSKMMVSICDEPDEDDLPASSREVLLRNNERESESSATAPGPGPGAAPQGQPTAP
eukprot:CAMPEP_0178424094 /NCGR_PEP_ID=MMETSP0689_2-20121128/28032_1 /TAXON_ID=160604 /ORGANISM="Amphidinium massartii, Strain CS-259" /LENGTH=459 /DNA_ID=CAMNT_0020045719 /DNA_START=74 /DNA_END=1455 /DNA_ORIENTATION=+